MNKPFVLVVEGDNAVKNLISAALETQNYKYHTAVSGSQATMEAISHKPDIILLNPALPDMDGIELIRKIRSWSNMPIIVISSHGEDRDKVTALDAGADDYLTKPFSVDELLARLRVVIRRLSMAQFSPLPESAVFENGELRVEYAGGCAYMKGVELHLTPIEYKLLCLLSKNIGKVLTHSYITSEIWGSAFDSNVASLRVFMTGLRRKIEPDSSRPKYIQTHIGVGYRMPRLTSDIIIQS